MDEDWSERLAADRTEGSAVSPVIAYGPSTASRPPVRAVVGLSAKQRCMKLGGGIGLRVGGAWRKEG
jgi:hypothetical protein